MNPIDPNTAKILIDTGKELGIDKLLPTVYADLLQPAVREVGDGLRIIARTAKVALAPLKATIFGYEQIEDILSVMVTARLAKKSPADIQTPDPVVAGPLLIGMSFTVQAPHLREMYANLLATAMHRPSSAKAHPSFVQIIQQLSPAEALILKEISRGYKSGDVLFREDVKNVPKLQPTSTLSMATMLTNVEPSAISDVWQSLCERCGVTEPVLARAFYRNLIRLGIFAERNEGESKGGNLADYLESSFARRLQTHVELSEFGDLFLDVCVRESI
jgi:hypothetical protein